MVPWMFSEFFRQIVSLSLYGFIIYSSFPAITLTAVEDKIGIIREHNNYIYSIKEFLYNLRLIIFTAKFQIPFLVIILLIIGKPFIYYIIYFF